MSSRIHTATPRRLIQLLAAALLTVLLAAASVLALAAPASAHNELLATDPPAGTTVDTLPAQLTLTFSGVILTDLGGNEVTVTDASGAALADGDPVVQNNVVTQPLTGPASGAIAVAWRVVSEDGHPVSGEFSFTVSAAASPTTTPSPTPSTATGTPSPTPVATPSPTATPAAATASSPVPWIILGTLLIAAVGGVVYLLVSRGRRPPRPPAEAPGDR